MESHFPFFVGIILVLLNVFGDYSVQGVQNNLTLDSKSSEVIAVRLTNCSSKTEGDYQCVRIEDCKAKRRRGNRNFCKWDGRPTHVCCPKKSDNELEKSLERYKRYDSYYDYEEDDDEFGPSSRFTRRDRYWDDDREDWMKSWRKPRHYHAVFNNHHDHDDDVEIIDYGASRNAFRGDEPECGVLEEEERGRILAATVGGFPVRTAASTPWMVAIGKSRINQNPQWFCGGVLLSRKIVLTAAHCLTVRTANLVRVGELDLNSNTEPAEPQDSEIESSVVHPDYRRPRHYNDIAIVRLKTPVRYTKYVRPICLPPNNRDLYENCQVSLTGWGTVKFGGEASSILQETQISVISNAECNVKYGDPATVRSNVWTLPRGIIDSQLCAGDEKGGRDACQGDSGGPIVKKSGRRRIVVGLVSSGLDCGSKFYPGIYTRVSYYTDWIRRFL